MNIIRTPVIEMYGPVIIGPGANKVTEPYKLKRFNTADKEAVSKAKKYAMEQNIRTVLLKQTKQYEVQQMINVRRTQAMVMLGRVHVGSINYDIREDTIRQTFICFGPVKCITVRYDPITQRNMGYAFVEFEYPESAQLAINHAQDITIGGKHCKVDRPTNMPQNSPLVEELYAEAERYARIYVSNVHPNLSGEDLKSVFEAFGTIESCALQPDVSRPGRHRGVSFIQYTTHQAAHEAMMAMNMFDLGGQLLRVAKAVTPPNLVVLPAATASGVGAMATNQMPAAAAVAAASITAQVQALVVQQISGSNDIETSSSRDKSRRKFTESKIPKGTLEAPTMVIPDKAFGDSARSRQRSGSSTKTKLENRTEMLMAKLEQSNEDDSFGPGYLNGESLEVDNIKISGREARTQMMQKLLRERVTVQRTMVLKNMIERADIDETIEDEVKEECGKFGKVSNIRIIVEDVEQPDFSGGAVAKEEVKIFVVFDNTEALLEAISRMNGRYFGGRIVQALKYDQELYDAGDFSG